MPASCTPVRPCCDSRPHAQHQRLFGGGFAGGGLRGIDQRHRVVDEHAGGLAPARRGGCCRHPAASRRPGRASPRASRRCWPSRRGRRCATARPGGPGMRHRDRRPSGTPAPASRSGPSRGRPAIRRASVPFPWRAAAARSRPCWRCPPGRRCSIAQPSPDMWPCASIRPGTTVAVPTSSRLAPGWRASSAFAPRRRRAPSPEASNAIACACGCAASMVWMRRAVSTVTSAADSGAAASASSRAQVSLRMVIPGKTIRAQCGNPPARGKRRRRNVAAGPPPRYPARSMPHREFTLEPDDIERLANLSGPFDAHLRLIELRLGVAIANRGDVFRVEADDADAAARAESLPAPAVRGRRRRAAGRARGAPAAGRVRG